jgi:hypothetical protein
MYFLSSGAPPLEIVARFPPNAAEAIFFRSSLSSLPLAAAKICL